MTVGRNGGTWADRRIAIRCICWCNPDFEIAADELLLRYMTGQVTTAESQGVASQLVEQITTTTTTTRALTDTASLTPGSFLSPEMDGKFVSDFYTKKEIFYLLRFSLGGQQYMKFGISDDFKKRSLDHQRSLKEMGMAWYHCLVSTDAAQLEQNFKGHCRALNLLTQVEVKPNENWTELVDLARTDEMSILSDVKVLEGQLASSSLQVEVTEMNRVYII